MDVGDLVPLGELETLVASRVGRKVSFEGRIGVEGYGVYIGSPAHGFVPEVVNHEGAYVLIFRKGVD